MYGNMTPEQVKELNALLSMTSMRSDGTINGEPNAQLRDLLNGPGPQRMSQQDLAMLQGDNSEPGVFYGSGQGGRQPVQPAQPMPRNFIQRSGGTPIDLDYAARGGSGVVPDGRQVQPDVWADGPRVTSSRPRADGRTSQMVKVPAMDGFGRQSSGFQEQILTPDYLNPAKIKELDYQKKLKDVRGSSEGSWQSFDSNGKKYRINSKSGEVQPVSLDGEQLGSKDAQTQRLALLAAKEQLATHETGVNSLIANINQLIGDDTKGGQQHPGLAGSVGMLDAVLPAFTQNQATAQSFIKSLKDKSAISGLQSIRQSGTAPGSITEKEWPIFQNLVNNLDASQDIDSFVKQLVELRQTARESAARAKATYGERSAGMGEPEQMTVPPGAVQYLRGNPSQAIRMQFDAKFGEGAAARILGGQ